MSDRYENKSCITCKRNRTPNATIAKIRLTQHNISDYDIFEIHCRMNYMSKLRKSDVMLMDIINSPCEYYKPLPRSK